MTPSEFAAEADRMGLTVAELAEIVVQGAMDALEVMVAQRRAEQNEEAA